jgi:hypothetical protein
MTGSSAIARSIFGLAVLLTALVALPAPTLAQNAEPALKAQSRTDVPIPVPDPAEDVEFDGGDGKLEFTSSASVRALAAFYRAAMKPLGWKEQASVINRSNMAVLELSKGDKSLTITIMQMGGQSNVTALGEGLVTAAGKAAADQQANATPPSKEDLEVEEMGGLPVPKRRTMSESSQTPFRRELNANLPIGLPFVLEFYRRELASRNWTEDASKASIQPDQATLIFNSANGPGVLKLGRKSGETTVNFVIRMTEAASKAGVLPKAGQVRVIFGNMTNAAATVTINKQAVTVGAGVGAKSPDGPSIDLPPGTYSYSVKSGSRAAQTDKMEVGADQTWGIVVGPGGGLALHVY